jgi:hypothetical protein
MDIKTASKSFKRKAWKGGRMGGVLEVPTRAM